VKSGRRPATSVTRWAGLVGVVAVLAAAVVVAVADKTYPGSPVAAPPPPPPQIGDCIADPPPSSVDAVPLAFATTFVACGPVRRGEVAAMLGGVDSATGGTAEGVDPCWDSAAPYLGLLPDGSLPGLHTLWFHLSPLAVGQVHPTDRQAAFGQHWVACVVYPLSGADATAAPPSYRTPLRNVFDGAAPPVALAVCGRTTDPGWSPQLVDCSKPHRVEEFAATSTEGAGITQAQLDTDCRAIAARMMARSDPTAGNLLTVTADSFGLDPEGSFHAGLSHLPGSGSICRVTSTDPGRQLQGPVLGIGDGPVPLG
jgi:hypothetical protein